MPEIGPGAQKACGADVILGADQARAGFPSLRASRRQPVAAIRHRRITRPAQSRCSPSAAWLVTREPGAAQRLRPSDPAAGTTLQPERSIMALLNPETVGKILAPIAAAVAPIIAERLAQELRKALPELAEKIADKVLDRVLPGLPKLDELDDRVAGAIRDGFKSLPDLPGDFDDRLKRVVRDVFNGLPFPFKI
ncbi:hypothetical protein SEA_FEFFERHEAD_96 [Mycobacterium phage Fefferhead]|nr:hypothetical protein SEA_FEFFERHEAD_96 [Mycobacterium phage Fefferhead]